MNFYLSYIAERVGKTNGMKGEECTFGVSRIKTNIRKRRRLQYIQIFWPDIPLRLPNFSLFSLLTQSHSSHISFFLFGHNKLRCTRQIRYRIESDHEENDNSWSFNFHFNLTSCPSRIRWSKRMALDLCQGRVVLRILGNRARSSEGNARLLLCTCQSTSSPLLLF